MSVRHNLEVGWVLVCVGGGGGGYWGGGGGGGGGGAGAGEQRLTTCLQPAGAWAAGRHAPAGQKAKDCRRCPPPPPPPPPLAAPGQVCEGDSDKEAYAIEADLAGRTLQFKVGPLPWLGICWA